MGKNDTLITISNMLYDAEICGEKAKVLTEDVQGSYFGKAIDSEADYWKVIGYYEAAGIKIDIVNDYLYELNKAMSALQEYVNKEMKDSSGKAGAKP